MRSALIAGVVAAVVAATSSTAATLVITSKNIKNGTIQAVDLSRAAKRALKGARGPRGAIGPQGLQGIPGPQGIQGPPGIQRLKWVVSNPVTLLPGQKGTAEAICPPGEVAVSGGFALTGADAGVTQSVNPDPLGRKWVANAENAVAPAETATVTAYAYCSPGISFQP